MYTIHPFTIPLHSKPHTYDACVFKCNLPPALLAEWLGFTTVVTQARTDTTIEISTEIDSREENSPTAPEGTQTRELLTTTATTPPDEDTFVEMSVCYRFSCIHDLSSFVKYVFLVLYHLSFSLK